MISKELYFNLLYIWIGLAVVVFFILLKVVVPYGRHASRKWGPTIDNKLGWFLMELPVIIVFSWLFFSGSAEKTLPVYIIYGLFMVHYLNRVFIFPLRIRSGKKPMPVIIVVLAIIFNLINGFFNGYWFGSLSDEYQITWIFDPRFLVGFAIFLIGMIINITSDNKLISLRKGGRKGYFIPRGGLFKYVSSPNLFGEIIEWIGWAIMGWSLAGFSFAIWTMANLIPRAINHHNWYKNKFSDYPKNRQVIFPKLF